ncbi:MAG TPA: dockerin [Polyangiaceae bacterium]|nr:dockerin [Polyangiaceae bacterium]
MRWHPFTALCSLLLCCRAGPFSDEQLPASVVPTHTGLKRGWDLNGIIGTGQSLAVGAEGRPLRATSPSFHNLKLDLGNRFFPALNPDSSRVSLVPLREPIRPFALGYPGPHPGNIYGETPHTCMASQISQLLLNVSQGRGDYVTVHSVVGEAGQPMSVIGKGAVRSGATGVAYERSLFETRAIARLAKAAQRSFGVGAVVLTHGESDAENPDYERSLVSLWQNYNADLRAITGQTTEIPLLLTQQSSCPVDAGSLPGSALAALRASQAPGSGVVCVGPRYQYSYAPDGVHLDALGYDRLGEKYGQAYFESVLRGQAWRPLEPLSARREGDVIRVDFHVPVPPLVWDGTLPAAPAEPKEWAAGRGFELASGDQVLTIAAVELSENRVLIHAPGAPPGPLLVRYAATAMRASRPQGSRRWGQLRDSDPFVGATTRTPQPNHAVTFELEVTAQP